MKCSINRNTDLEKYRVDLKMELATPAEILGMMGLTEGSTWHETSLAIVEALGGTVTIGEYTYPVSFGGFWVTRDTYLIGWISQGYSPKLGIMFYLNETGNLAWYIPKRGNLINLESEYSIGWDAVVGGKSNPPTNLNYIRGELGLSNNNSIIVILNNILEPDIEAMESEFLAYADYTWI